jgi:hypothetical protein
VHNYILLAAVFALVPMERALAARRSATGRPAKDRTALATPFLAKAILNLPTMRDLISRPRVDETLRRPFGASSAGRSRLIRLFLLNKHNHLHQKLLPASIASAICLPEKIL